MHKVISADGTTIAYDRYGTGGPAVIFVGGAFQHRAFDPTTAEAARLLSEEGFTVYHYDRRGRGDSTDTQPYAIEREIEDIAALAATAPDPLYLFGHSSGAILALDAVVAGVPAAKIALYEPATLVDDTRMPSPAGHLDRVRALATQDRTATVEAFLTDGVGVPAEFVAQMKHAPVWPGFEAVAHTLPYDTEITDPFITGKPLPRDRWATVTIPVLAGRGSASEQWLQNSAAAAAELFGAPLVTLEGQDHGPASDLLAGMLRDFFRG
ncbi:alpha/beta fold hydrolase [Hamadaea tsunoensis]|uniref:alpha/beta fold hydrolase n=1 Tax=Hamadaea tsunoensis TaxID=53368 RepID=UPI000413627A|nr:alpha/beta hydrolase [Hamadaea tsunoensis]